MNENYGKHVFEMREDWAWFHGTIERETKQIWFMRGGTRRLKAKSDVLLPSSVDPKSAADAYTARYRDFHEAIADATKALHQIKCDATECAIDAMLTSNRREPRS